MGPRTTTGLHRHDRGVGDGMMIELSVLRRNPRAKSIQHDDWRPGDVYLEYNERWTKDRGDESNRTKRLLTQKWTGRKFRVDCILHRIRESCPGDLGMLAGRTLVVVRPSDFALIKLTRC